MAWCINNVSFILGLSLGMGHRVSWLIPLWKDIGKVLVKHKQFLPNPSLSTHPRRNILCYKTSAANTMSLSNLKVTNFHSNILGTKRIARQCTITHRRVRVTILAVGKYCKFWVRVFSLLIQHKERMRRIILSSMTCLVLPHFFTFIS